MIGQTLSHFQITAKLGEGGMGEVYRAEDTTLGREVAIKVLPAALTENRERLARFEREARVLASLNHPNIAGIHEVGEDGGVHFLAMELAEGEDLAERLRRGAVALEEAIPVALQIAEALEEAHEKGIVHRDLKPQNIKLTPDGTVKVLDFGLAKALDKPETGGSGKELHLSHSPTMTLGATVEGVILGTAAYMSPEQAKGLVADKRSDIWAWGVVVTEMLTGQSLFAGETVTETLAFVMTREPDLDDLPTSTPPRLRELLERCLERDRKLRLRDIGEARVLLRRIDSGDRDAQLRDRQDGQSAKRGMRSSWLGLAVLTSLVVGGLLGFLVSPKPQDSSDRVRRFVVDLPDGYSLTWGAHPLAIAADDSSIVYSATTGERGDSKLFRQRLDRFEPEELPDTRGAESPFFSPDGRFVGFLQNGALRRISLEETTIGTITEGIAIFRGASWGTGDEIVFADLARGVFRIPANGGQEVAATRLDETGLHRFPIFLPESDDFVFSVALGDRQRLAIASPVSDDWKRLEIRGAGARYVPGGFLAYGHDGPLRIVPFDRENLTLAGDPRTVLPDVYTNIGLGLPHFAVSARGSLAYVEGQLRARLVWVDRSGQIEEFEVAAGSDLGVPATPRLSPDGNRVAVSYTRPGQGAMVWILDRETGTRTPLMEAGEAFAPLWSPDSGRVMFVENTAGTWKMAWKELETGSLEQPDLPGMARPISWHPDGQRVVIDMGGESWIYSMDGTFTPLWPEGETLADPSFSPDGSTVLGISVASGRPEVVLRPFPAGGRTVVVSTEGGTEPAWSPNGREIFYRHGERVLVVPILFDGSNLQVGPPRLLFQGLFGTTSQWHSSSWAEADPNYSVSDDGERLLMVALDPDSVPDSVHVVMNWSRELESGAGE